MADLGIYGPGAPFRFAGRRSRSVVSDSVGAVRYPSPFFDLGSMYLPSSFKTMLKWCRYYFLTNPLINTVVYKMAEYPVTDLILDDENTKLVKKWSSFFKDVIHFKKFLVEVGLDYGAYGNAFVSIHYPFHKYLKCERCGHMEKASTQNYKFRSFKFSGECKRCGHQGDFRAEDVYVGAYRDIKMIRWNPEHITIKHNDATGESQYYYKIPSRLSNDIKLGKRHVIESIPQAFIHAVDKNKALLFNSDNIYHMKRPTIADKDKGWGLPMILPVLKDVYYLQILRKAQEAIAVEHAVPLRLLFPAANSATSDPYSSVNLNLWKNKIEAEIMRWRCVSPSSLVETQEGLRPAGEVQVGDKLKNKQGEFETVFKRRERPMDEGERAYRLDVRGQPAVDTVFSEEHPIWAAKKYNNGNGHKLGVPEFIEVAELSPGDYVGYPVKRNIVLRKEIDVAPRTDRAATDQWVYTDSTHTDLPEAFEYLSRRPGGSKAKRSEVLEKFGWGLNSYKAAQTAVREGRTLRRVPRYIPFDEEFAYVLGLYAAEGNTTPKGVSFSLHKDEKDIVDRLDKFFLSRFNAELTGREASENGIQITYCSTIAAQLFHSLLPGTARNKRLPRVVREAPDELAAAAVKGVIDGDGCYYDDKTVLGTASVQLAEDVRQLILSWEILPGISFIKGGPTTICGKETFGNGRYMVQVSGSMNDRFLAKLDGRPYDGKSFSKIGVFKDGYAWFRIKGIEEVEVPTVVSFQMDGDHTFCTWGVATHNCDNNYIPVLPMPVGSQSLGGDGRALMLAQEYRVWEETIITGMGVPIEFVKGGLSFSGSSVSLRMLENHFLDQKSDHLELAMFIMNKVGAFLQWQPVESVRFKRFKMADDLQRSAFNLQLNQSAKISDRSLLEESDWDVDQESSRIEQETARRIEAQRKQALGQASIQGEAQLAMQKYQLKGQKMMRQAEADAMMMQQQQQEAQQLPMVAGIPGEAGPMAMGADQVAQQGMMNQQGMLPPVDVSDMAQQQQQAQGTEAQMQQQQQAKAMAGQPVPQQQMQAPASPPQGVESPLTSEHGPHVDMAQSINMMVSTLDQMPAHQQQPALQRLASFSPFIFQEVLKALNARKGAHQSSASMPQPQQRAPRRGPEATT